MFWPNSKFSCFRQEQVELIERWIQVCAKLCAWYAICESSLRLANAQGPKSKDMTSRDTTTNIPWMIFEQKRPKQGDVTLHDLFWLIRGRIPGSCYRGLWIKGWLPSTYLSSHWRRGSLETCGLAIVVFESRANPYEGRSISESYKSCNWQVWPTKGGTALSWS